MASAAEVADVLARLAFGAELLGESPMRARAFSNGARVVKKLGSQLPAAFASGELAATRGIGKGLLDVIGRALQDRDVPALVELEARVPAGLLEARHISGLGPKRVRALWETLGLTTIGEIEYACTENRLLELDGFGPKLQQSVLDAIAERRARDGQLRLDRVDAAFTRVRQALVDPRLAGLVLVGAARRGRSWVDRLELLALYADGTSADEAAGLAAAWTPVASAAAAAPVELVVAPSRDAARASVRAIADAVHLEALRVRGLDALEPPPDEDEVYRRLGLHPVPVERREGTASLVGLDAPPPPRLVERGDLQGALHNHTTASDGLHDLAAMRAGAERAGLAWLGISEHSRASAFAGGLSAEALAAQRDAIRALPAGPCRVLAGVESDILVDGALDYPDALLSSLDFVVASVHQRHRLDRDATTARMLRAVEARCCDVVGHPTGRLIGGRPPNDFDLDAFLDACAARGVAVELNAGPQRLDLDAEALVAAKRRGVQISIAADAHSVAGLDHLDYGLRVARRAGLEPSDVLNRLDAEALLAWVRERRR
jgi:DNA polymerase (family 10)